MNICKYCNTHYTNTKNTHNRWCSEYKEFTKECEQKCTREFFQLEYIENGKSFAHISREMGLDKDRLVKRMFRLTGLPERSEYEWQRTEHKDLLRKESYMKKYGVEEMLSSKEVQQFVRNKVKEKYGVENVSQIPGIQQKIQNTMLDRYGVTMALLCPKIKEKRDKTMMEKYGVLNNMQLPEFKERRDKTMMEKYGSTIPLRNNEIKNKFLISRFSNSDNIRYSKTSQKFFWDLYNLLPNDLKECAYFAELNQEYFIKNEQRIVFVDFCIPKIKYCLEYNGDYWHANPKIYTESFYNSHTKKSAKDIWESDANKHKIIRNKDYVLDVIWESDLPDVNTILDRIIQIHKDNLDGID